MAEDEKNEQEEQGTNGQSASGLSRLLNKDILIPAAATAATAAAAAFAAKKGPDLKDRVVGEAKQSANELGKEGAEGAKEAVMGGGGPLGSIASGVTKLIPGKGGGGDHKKTRRLPIQRWTDVGVPIDDVYEKWTNFEEFPKFMHRVQKVERKDDSTVEWEEKIWFSKRQWQAEITDERENDRIAWKTTSGTKHSGVVSFHRLDDELTRVLVTMDFQPAGMIEKMGSGLRFVKRAVQADLARFKAYAEMEETEGLEYSASPSETENQQDDNDNGDGDGDGDDRAQARDDGSSSNGRDQEDRDAERRERDARRKERRESLSAS